MSARPASSWARQKAASPAGSTQPQSVTSAATSLLAALALQAFSVAAEARPVLKIVSATTCWHLSCPVASFARSLPIRCSQCDAAASRVRQPASSLPGQGVHVAPAPAGTSAAASPNAIIRHCMRYPRPNDGAPRGASRGAPRLHDVDSDRTLPGYCTNAPLGEAQ